MSMQHRRSIADYSETIYAGVLGKIIGVYMGRPVEGWTYEKIREAFGEISHYENERVGAPLIVPDDDISGTFAFIRTLYDHPHAEAITAREIGEGWLDAIIEDKTILWWGGLSRSTEHTAFLRLKAGIPAPESGSIRLNGRAMAEQIGAEIFIDTWAMACPDDPERATDLARKAASVSHDGLAVEAACYLAAMESMAFSEKRIDALMREGRAFVRGTRLLRLIDAIEEQCAKTTDWRLVREWIARNHGYDQYPGNCPMATNHLVVLAALMLGGDDFHKSISIASSMGWDTDCNAGNVGCLNGIRLGLKGIDGGIDLRSPVMDRMYVVTSDGGSCVTDAVQETKKLVAAAAKLRGESIALPSERFSFHCSGSTQGFYPDPTAGYAQALTGIENALHTDGKGGLRLIYRQLAHGSRASVCVDTFTDMQPKGKAGTSYFEVLASPALYATQTVRAMLFVPKAEAPKLRFFVDHYNESDQLTRTYSEEWRLGQDENETCWTIPGLGGQVIYRLGLELTSEDRTDGSVILRTLDWVGAPEKLSVGKAMQMSPSLTPWTTETTWLKSFVSSADHFCPDYTTTFSLSHTGKNGVVTTGTADWKDYSVSSILTLAQQEAAGLVLRANGHRRYYAALLTGGYAVIVMKRGKECAELARVPFPFQLDHPYELRFEALGRRLRLFIDGTLVTEAIDASYDCGGAGLIVEAGAILADGFMVERI